MSDQAAAPETEVSDQPEVDAVHTEAPADHGGSAEQGEHQGESFSQFDLSEVPEDARQYVEQYSKRLQGDYTRKTQEIAAQRKQYEEAQPILDWYQSLTSDPEIMAATYAQLQEMLDQSGYWDTEDDTEGLGEGFEFNNDESQQEFHDPRLDPLLEEINAAKQEQEYEAYLDSMASQMGADLEDATKDLGYKLSDDELAFVTNYAMTMAHDDGRPDVHGAVTKLRAIQAAELTRVIDSKKAPRVETGVPGSDDLDLNDTDVRRQYMEDLVNASEARDNA